MPSLKLGIGFSSAPSAVNTLVDKMTEAQVDKMLDHAAQDSERQQIERNQKNLYTTILLGMGIVATVVICCSFVFYGNAMILKDIIIFFAGAGGGYGFGIGQQKSKAKGAK
jgi:hypothetical protein